MTIPIPLSNAVAFALTLMFFSPGSAALAHSNQHAVASNPAYQSEHYSRVGDVSFATTANAAAASLQTSIDTTTTKSGAYKRQVLIAAAGGQDSDTGFRVAEQSADLPASTSFKLTAEIDKVAFIDSDDFTGFHVLGTIDADRFKRAWVMIGAGREPTTWTYVGQKQKYPIHNGVLSKIKLSEFDGSDIWQVMVNVEHRNGVVQSDTYLMKIQ